MIKFFLFLFALILMSTSQLAFPEKAKVRIDQVSDMDFGIATAGDGPKTIVADTTETAENASFLVTGDRNRAYSITLPTSMDLTKKGPGAKINVSNFQSYPPQGANGYLNSNGQQMVYVGATRAALPNDQVSGSYSGKFTVTVVY